MAFWEQTLRRRVIPQGGDDVLLLLECYLEAELEWMDRIGDEENAESDDDEDSDDDYNSTTEDEGYSTSPEVDFDKYDYWALGLNSFLWRIACIKGVKMGFGPYNFV